MSPRRDSGGLAQGLTLANLNRPRVTEATLAWPKEGQPKRARPKSPNPHGEKGTPQGVCPVSPRRDSVGLAQELAQADQIRTACYREVTLAWSAIREGYRVVTLAWSAKKLGLRIC